MRIPKNEFLKRILVVDDDVDLLMLLERRLEREGYEVQTAASIAEAEETVHLFSPHLILLDINVQGEDGRQLCWKLKHSEDNSEVKVIIISGYDYDKRIAALFGADELLPKPLQTDFLLQKVEMCLMPWLSQAS